MDERPDTELRRGAVLIQEAYALALAGRPRDAVEFLDRVLRAGAVCPALATSAHLARARLLAGPATGASSSAPERKWLESVTEDPFDGWRALLELARRENALDERLLLLTRALRSFQRGADARGELGSLLASLLSSEVARIERSLSEEETDSRAPCPDRVRGTALPTPSGVGTDSLAELIEVGKRLASRTEPDEVLRAVLHEAVRLVDADRGFVVRERHGEFEVVLWENLNGGEVDTPAFELSRNLVREAIRERRPLSFTPETLPTGHDAARSLAGIGVSAVACVPIEHAGEILGALYLDRWERHRPFDDHSCRLLSLFAGLAATALINAREHRRKQLALETAEEALRRHRTRHRTRYRGIVGASERMQAVYRLLDRIAPTELPVLIVGETGTGKELAARVIHERGPRRAGEFVAVNCAGLTETLLESELFGHERGAFTGADRARPGLFEIAHRGTLFLDEVGDTSPRMQAELLRALQFGEVRRVGGRETIRVDVRIIAATHRDLRVQIRSGEFREDLYYRLNVLAVELPPLRERHGDVPLLVAELLSTLENSTAPPVIGDDAMRRLEAHSWPGNVRELENVLRRLVVLGVSPIQARHLPPELLPASSVRRNPLTLREAERRAIHRAMRASAGNKSRAARILGIDRNTLYKKLKEMEP